MNHRASPPVVGPLKPPRSLSFVLLACGLVVGLDASLWGQSTPPDSLFRGFEPSSDYVLEIDGQPAPKVENYFSQRIPAFLILARELPTAVLLNVRTRQVQTVHLLQVVKQADGSMSLLADAELMNKGSFEFVTKPDLLIRFSVDGHQLVMKDRPPLLGPQDVAAIQSYDPQYGRLADQYQPDGGRMAALREQSKPVKVQVFFGSWCPFCKRYVPRMIKVAQQLADSPVTVEFYGLPRDLSQDQITKQMEIQGVPTGIVYVDGREVGRIQADEWKAPEVAVRKLLR